MRRPWILATLTCLALVSAPILAQGSGSIDGRVTRDNGTGVGGVTVVVAELGAVEITNSDGSFEFDGVPAGTYTVNFSLGDNADSETDVVVAGGETTSVAKLVDWDVSFAETITVFSASRRRERIVEAPAAVTSIPEEQIEREAAAAQIPKLFEFTPGVQATQSGVYDFNFNTRGFNSSLNRRIVVLIDGRDPSVPFLGAQEWGITSQYMDDLANAELVRGPSSALYGANAFNGVLNLITKQPRYSQGGKVTLAGGDLSTIKAGLRWAGALGGDWYAKVHGSYLESDDFAVSRTLANGTDYAGFCTAAGQTDCFVPEAVPLAVDQNKITFGSVRLDKHLGNGDFFSIDGGYGDAEAPAIQTGIGRFSLPDVSRSWTRFNYTSNHWNFLGYYNTREGNDQLAVQSGRLSYLDSEDYSLELQTNWDFLEGKVRLVAGATYGETEIDSSNPAGIQTLIFAPVDSDATALYSQVDFDIGDSLKLVLAGRYDDSSLHEEEFSPKAALVWSFADSHSIRLSYNEAFQVANYSEFFLQGDAAPPITGLAAVEAQFCAPFGIDCGLDFVRVLAVGNDDLAVEEVTSWEVGYTGIIGGKAFVTLDYYQSELDNFITDLLPNVGTGLGRLNPDFGPYAPPAATSGIILPAPYGPLAGLPLDVALQLVLQGALGPTYAALSNNFDGTPAVIGATYTNFGKVDTEGIDFGVNAYITPELRASATYSWFDFDPAQELPGDPLLPNAPEHQYSFGLAYVAQSFDVALDYRWVDDFRWAVGTLYRGTVPSYDTVDLTANYRITESFEIGIDVNNLLDDEHYESFGGDLLERRALGHVRFTW